MTKEELLEKKVGFVSLGCDKNRVDLEHIMGKLKNAGFTLTEQLDQANIIIINTCSFIESARKESIETILNISNLKNITCEKLIITGCLTQMGYSDLESSLPEVDKFINIADNENIVEIIFSIYNVKYDNNINAYNRVISTPNHYAYLKIADGCNNFCSYCKIPYIRGRFRSVPMEILIDEAKDLAKNGVKELILVAQDTTKYGIDLYKEYKLVQLIQELSKIEDIKWIRLLYCYPELVNDDLINEIKTNNKVVKYIDIPMQHINNNILRKMNRKTNKEQLINLITKLKSEIPQIAIRSTFILGFPGETMKNFNELLNFLKFYKLNNVGFFPYSKEEGTQAFNLKHQKCKYIKLHRLKKAYKVQSKISYLNNLNLINKNIFAIIDEDKGDYLIGRGQNNAPEIDGQIKIYGKANIGDIVQVKITNSTNYDLEGVIQ